MVFDEIIEKFLARMKRLISFLPSKKRLYFKELKKHFESRAIMLYGARGVGKTTFLLNLAKDKDFIYLFICR